MRLLKETKRLLSGALKRTSRISEQLTHTIDQSQFVRVILFVLQYTSLQSGNRNVVICRSLTPLGWLCSLVQIGIVLRCSSSVGLLSVGRMPGGHLCRSVPEHLWKLMLDDLICGLLVV